MLCQLSYLGTWQVYGLADQKDQCRNRVSAKPISVGEVYQETSKKIKQHGKVRIENNGAGLLPRANQTLSFLERAVSLSYLGLCQGRVMVMSLRVTMRYPSSWRTFMARLTVSLEHPII